MSFSRDRAPQYAASQGALIILRAPVDAFAFQGKPLLGQTLVVAGDYECGFATDGMNDVEAEVMCSAVTGSVTPKLQAMRGDGESCDTSANEDAGVPFVAGTAQVLTLSNLLGRTICKLKFTIPGSGAITFDKGTTLGTPTAVAEYNGL